VTAIHKTRRRPQHSSFLFLVGGIAIVVNVISRVLSYDLMVAIEVVYACGMLTFNKLFVFLSSVARSGTSIYVSRSSFFRLSYRSGLVHWTSSIELARLVFPWLRFV
jgi:hypothetical protein